MGGGALDKDAHACEYELRDKEEAIRIEKGRERGRRGLNGYIREISNNDLLTGHHRAHKVS